MAKYGAKAHEKVEAAIKAEEKGTLKSGKSGKTVTSKKQAIAIGLSEARKEGGKVPPAKRAAKKSSAKKTTAKKSGGRKTAAKKTTTRKTAAKKTAGKKSPARKSAKKSAKKRSS